MVLCAKVVVAMVLCAKVVVCLMGLETYGAFHKGDFSMQWIKLFVKTFHRTGMKRI